MSSAQIRNSQIVYAQDLWVGFKKRWIIKSVSLSVESGEMVSIGGRNGAGKSTLLRCMSGLAPIFRGQVLILGRTPRAKPHELARLGLTYLPQGGRVFGNSTVQENLDLARLGSKQSTGRATTMEALVNAPELVPLLPRPASTLSGGERQLLSLSMALLRRGRLLLLDEPFAGLNDMVRSRLILRLREIVQKEDVAIILIEHDADVSAELGARRLLLLDGRLSQHIQESNNA